ncbi:MAG TPA: MFS transporter [Candidatus Limnocylindrales bacterium]|nr:MFS transporter [Candidatus Limnocylindrales bacterium]
MALPAPLPAARRVTRLSMPLIGAFVVGAIAYGGLYTFPALSVAFAEEFGISRTVAVTPWTMFLVVTAVASPLLGRAYDEFADRDLLTASMVLLAAGWLAVYLAPDVSLVILAFAAFHAVGLQLAFIGTSTAIARRYAGVSGTALGIAYAGPGIGVAVALPVAAGLIESAGWRTASLAFLGASLAGVVFVWLMTSGPAIVVPERGAGGGVGRTRAKETELAARATGLHETSAPGAVSAAFEPLPAGSGGTAAGRTGIRRIVRTRRFWVLFAGAAAIGAFDEGVLQAFVPHAVGTGFGADFAASALGAQALAYVAGQVVGGTLSDRIGRRIVGVVAAAVIGGGVLLAFGASSGAPAMALAGIALHGLGTGATIAVRSAAFSDVFGGPSFGTIFGLLAVAYPIGGTIAVYTGALASDRVGSYAPLVALVIVALAGWAAALWLAGPRRRELARRRLAIGPAPEPVTSPSIPPAPVAPAREEAP